MRCAGITRNISMFAPDIIINDTATPVNTRRSALVALANLDTPRTIIVAPSAPKKAKKGTVNNPINKPVCKGPK